MVLIKHALVDVDAIAHQYKLSKYFFWALFRKRKAETIPESGVTKTGRVYRIDPERFDSWFLGDGKRKTVPPPPAEPRDEPTAREIMDYFTQRSAATAQRIDLLQATVTSQGEKLDHLTRLVTTALKSGVNHGKRRK